MDTSDVYHQWVSIPFKREGISKDDPLRIVASCHVVFQFPSNGKAYPKKGEIINHHQVEKVFQFPSNGKAYPKQTLRDQVIDTYHCFNSLQTGKHIQRHIFMSTFLREMFQFPSNGKPYTKRGWKTVRANRVYNVSIPFKRENISKAKILSPAARKGSVSIPFKRENISKGKGILFTLLLILVSIPFKRESIYKDY